MQRVGNGDFALFGGSSVFFCCQENFCITLKKSLVSMKLLWNAFKIYFEVRLYYMWSCLSAKSKAELECKANSSRSIRGNLVNMCVRACMCACVVYIIWSIHFNDLFRTCRYFLNQNSEALVQKVAETYPIRRAAQISAFFFHKSKEIGGKPEFDNNGPMATQSRCPSLNPWLSKLWLTVSARCTRKPIPPRKLILRYWFAWSYDQANWYLVINLLRLYDA